MTLREGSALWITTGNHNFSEPVMKFCMISVFKSSILLTDEADLPVAEQQISA